MGSSKLPVTARLGDMRLTEAQEKERATWQYRAIQRLRGNQTITGCILLSALGRVASNPPTMGLHAVIDENGVLHTDFVDKYRVVHEALPICEAAIMAEAFKRVADELQFTDAETIAMFTEVRRWVSKDLRAINNMEGDHDG